MKKRILFVDDEPDILTSLRRMLRPTRSEWDMDFCESGPVALTKMAEAPYDVVVSDIRMPEMDGVELLSRIREQYPRTVRIALSGHSDQATLLRSVGPTHQFLAKPCDADNLIDVILRSCALRDLLADTSLVQFATTLESLPSLPTLYVEVMEELKSPTSSLAKVGDIIARDIGMTAKILQLVNSAFFGIPRQIASPAQAASLLGVEIIRSLVLSVKIFSEAGDSTPSQLDLDRIWRQAYHASLLGKRIAEEQGLDQKSVGDIFLAGMLHDVGILVLASGFPGKYADLLQFAANDPRKLIIAEEEELGKNHAQIGGYLMGLWGLPDSIVEAIYFHHLPSEATTQTFCPLTAVHVAVALLEVQASSDSLPAEEVLDMPYLERLQITGQIPAWQEMTEELTAVELTAEGLTAEGLTAEGETSE